MLAQDAVVPLPGALATAVAWRSKGQLHVTVIAKATFTFAPDAEMPRAEPQPIFLTEVHHGNNPSQSVRFTSDLAPYRARADVTFTGSAHAPKDGPARGVPVRLALFDGQRPLFDRWLLAQDSGGFQRMPIVYERALRGPTGQENPLGLDEAAGEPNIVDPGKPHQPAGFGPIARAWPARKRLLGSTPRKALESPIAEIPDDFDWSYFQAAPPEQRTDLLRGDEWIILEGLHPALPRLRTRLPHARAAARIYGLAAHGVPDGQPLDLALDTLRIDGDEQRSTLVFRRSFPVASEAALTAIRIVAGVSAAGEALAWPEPRDALRLVDAKAAPLKVGPGAPPAGAPAETLMLAPEQEEAAHNQPALPFEAAPSGLARSPSTIPPGPAQPVQHVPTGTLALPSEDSGYLDLIAAPVAAPMPAIEPVAAPVTASEAAPTPVPPPAPPEAKEDQPEAKEDPPEAREDPGAISVERCAAIAAELAEDRARRAQILAAHGISEPRWAEAEGRWGRAMDQGLDRGDRSLRDAYDAAYVTAWEKARGRLSAAEYAGLTLAAERGELTSALSAAKIRRAVWMRIQRAYRKRLEADPELAASVKEALSAARGPAA